MMIPVRMRFAAGFNASPVDGVGNADHAYIEKTCGIRHGRHYGHGACLVAVTAKKLAELSGNRPERTGIICNGGPSALHPAWTMLNRARSAGAEFINPLQFPPTLVSAAATSAAAAVGAHSFAYIAGHDQFAFFEVLHRAAQAVRFGMADQVFAIAMFARDASVEAAAARANLNLRTDVAMGFCLDPGTPSPGDLLLLAAGTCEEIAEIWPEATRYEARWDGGKLSCSWDIPIQDPACWGATGGVLLHLAASRHETLRRPAREQVFSVSIRTGNCGMAVAVKIHSEHAFPPEP